MTITNKIKALMQMTNTKQIDIAKTLNTPQSNVSRMINLDTTMPVGSFIKLVEAMGCKAEISIVLPDGTKF